MKHFAILSLTIISILTTTYGSSTPNSKLKEYLDLNKKSIFHIATNLYEYTYLPFSIHPENCVAKENIIGPVGVCLISLQAYEENITTTFAVTVTSHYSGTGEITPEIKLTLIDYTL